MHMMASKKRQKKMLLFSLRYIFTSGIRTICKTHGGNSTTLNHFHTHIHESVEPRDSSEA